MTDHKFEPFQQVLIRNAEHQAWSADIFSHISSEEGLVVCVGGCFNICIPYTPETKHLLGTSQPYEPPVDESKRFKPGEKVEIFSSVGEWKEAIYLTHQSCHCANGCQHLVYIPWGRGMGAFEPDRIRPLPDDTADTVNCGICGKPINERTAANDVECGPCCPEHYEDDTAAN